MKIDIEYKDLLIIQNILEERNVVYKDQIVNGYTDNVSQSRSYFCLSSNCCNVSSGVTLSVYPFTI